MASGLAWVKAFKEHQLTLLLHAVGKQIHQEGHTIIQVCSSDAKFKKFASSLLKVSAFFKTLRPCAKQLNMKEKMRRVLSRAVVE